MDNMDIMILKSLRKNARLTASAMSEEIGLSVSAVIERIKKLENSGIIKGYTIDVDQAKMGNTMVALMDVSLKHPDYYDGFAASSVNCYSIGSATKTKEVINAPVK